ncbi:MAG: hypothetical protein ACRDP7_05425 [Trebonia sp.]
MTSPEEAAWTGSASRQAALAAPVRDLHGPTLPPATGSREKS